MGLFDFFKKKSEHNARFDFAELSRRLALSPEQIRAVKVAYRPFSIPKRSGGRREILAPEDPLKQIQRLVLHRLLGKLKAHPLATGFERNHSIVTNAVCHTNRKVIVRLDIKDFFGTISEDRIRDYFCLLGWDKEASDCLGNLCAYKGSLPQGAPTSPRLSNLVNYRMDTRLAKLASKLGANYTRYADDMTFSFAEDSPLKVKVLKGLVKYILIQEGYKIQSKTCKKLKCLPINKMGMNFLMGRIDQKCCFLHARLLF